MPTRRTSPRRAATRPDGLARDRCEPTTDDDEPPGRARRRDPVARPPGASSSPPAPSASSCPRTGGGGPDGLPDRGLVGDPRPRRPADRLDPRLDRPQRQRHDDLDPRPAPRRRHHRTSRSCTPASPATATSPATALDPEPQAAARPPARRVTDRVDDRRGLRRRQPVDRLGHDAVPGRRARSARSPTPGPAEPVDLAVITDGRRGGDGRRAGGRHGRRGRPTTRRPAARSRCSSDDGIGRARGVAVRARSSRRCCPTARSAARRSRSRARRARRGLRRRDPNSRALAARIRAMGAQARRPPDRPGVRRHGHDRPLDHRLPAARQGRRRSSARRSSTPGCPRTAPA